MADFSTAVYESISEANRNQWNNVVEQSSLGSVFHRYEWLRAIERGLGRGQKHVVVRKNGNPVALLPNTVTTIDGPDSSTLEELVPVDRIPDSLPTSRLPIPDVDFDGFPLRGLISTNPGFGGPVILGDEQNCLGLLFEALSDDRGPSIHYHSIKAKEPEYMRYGKVLAKRGYEPVLLNCRFELNLSIEYDEIIEQMDKDRRYSLRKARANDFRINELPFDDVVSSTYERYLTEMERVDGHVYPVDFFEELAENMVGRVKLFSVEVDGTEAGRHLYLLDDEQSTVHHYFSIIGDSSNFEYHPSELLHAHAIEWGQENGYQYYDFGETGSTFMDGTFRYKERYGGRVIPTLRWQKGYTPVLWKAYKIGRHSYQKFMYKG